LEAALHTCGHAVTRVIGGWESGQRELPPLAQKSCYTVNFLHVFQK
jgi:hypothetical protein